MMAAGKSGTPKRRQKTARRGDGPKLAYDYIRDLIITSQLSAGARIEERAIVDELGLSRTPVRQALMRLAAEGLVESLPNHGARIPPLDIEDAQAFFEAFEYLLIATTHLAAKRRTDRDLADIIAQRDAYEDAAARADIKAMIETNEEFHLAIARAGKNAHLVRLVGDLLTKAIRLDGIFYWRGDGADSQQNYKKSQKEHRNIVRAIQDEDPRKAETAILDHVKSFREPFLKLLCESEAEFINLPQHSAAKRRQ